MKKTAIVILSILSFNISYSETVNCQITGIKSKTGSILVGVFNSADSFENRKTVRSIELSKKKLKNGTLAFEVDLPPAEYGFSILDDNDDNGEMEYNFFGVPKEGFGFSNYFHSGIFAPKFEAFKFLLRRGKSRFVKIKMKYM